MNLTSPLFNESWLACNQLHTDLKYELFSSSLLIISFLSVIFNATFFTVARRTSAFHANVCLLFQNFSLATVFLNLHSLARSVCSLLALYFGFGAFSQWPLSCQLTELVHNVCYTARTLSLSFLGLERLVSNTRMDFVESESPTRLGYLLLFLTWSLGIGSYALMTVLSATSHDGAVICFCHLTFVRPVLISVSAFALGLCSYSLLASSCICLYRRSVSTLMSFSVLRRRRRDHNSLTERYHLAQNVRLCQLLWPSIVLHFCALLVDNAGSLLVRMTYVSALDERGVHAGEAIVIFYILLLMNCVALDSTCHPILLILRHRRFKRIFLTSVFPLFNACVQVEDEVAEQQHSLEEITQLTGAGRYRFRRRSPTGEAIELVDYRMNPDQHENILNAMWTECGMKQKGRLHD